MENEARKYPGEVFPLDVGFSSGMDTGEAIVPESSAVTAYDGDNEASGIVQSGSIAAANQRLFAMFTGGETGKVYRVEFKAVTNAATPKTLIHNIQLRIIEFKVKP